jgi:DNA-binding LacI/PurR family transcriptional regulator
LVSEKTRQKVADIISKHSFSPNILAQGLAGMPTKIIGVMIDELDNDFYIELTNGIDSIISAENYSIQLMNSRFIPEREFRGIRSMILSRVDGILMAPMYSDSEATNLLKNSGVPYVLINCTSDDPEVSYICSNNYEGGKKISNYINSLNRKQLIIIDTSGHQTVLERVAGLEAYLDTENIRVIKYPKTKTYEDGYKLVPVLAEQNAIGTVKTTLFVTNDYVALGMLARLVEMGISIPHQVSLIGYDDVRLASLCRIPLTTVSQSVYTMGQTAALDLIERIRSPHSPPSRRITEPGLIIRESTCPAENLHRKD